MLTVSKHMQLKRMNHSKLFLPFFLYFLFISFASSFSTFSNTTHKCSPKQSHALLLFKQNLFSVNDTSYDPICQRWLGSDYHPIMMNWNKSVDCCTWNGVICSRFTGDVIALDLYCGMLRGTIDSNTTLFNLPHLQRLNLAFNDFRHSQLPGEIRRFSNSLTHLNISQCGLTGPIPLEISLLPKLVSLDLSLNGFDFSLEPHIFNNLIQNSTLLTELLLPDVFISFVLPTHLNISSSLKILDVGNTGMRGKLPNNIFDIQKLEKLDLSGNDGIIGPLPKVNTSISNHLNWLDLSSTGTTGEIPNSIGHLTSLNYLDLSSLNLSGVIPDSIGRLKFLNTLSLFSCSLMGSLPKSLDNLRNLTALYLSSNKLNGTLPSWLFTLPSLEIIFLDNNAFNGSLPSELFNHRSLKVLSLRDNQLSGKIDLLDQGPIQQSFRQLINLTYLDLSFNNFRGEWELDTLLSSLTNLEVLDLSYSGLSVVTNNVTYSVSRDFHVLELAACNITTFPESLRTMKNLNELDLSSNKIHGRVPDWVGEIGGNELYYLNLSHNSITGLPKFQWDGLRYLYLQSNLIQESFPLSICNMGHLLYLDLSNNSFNGVIPECLGNVFSSLMMANLGRNRFQGTIPNIFENCGHLEGLALNRNQLQGEVPSSLSKCRSLKLLDLGNNHLKGTFPSWLGGLQNLQVLVLKSNNMNGPIVTSSTIDLPFSSMMVLDLSDNGFVGHIPGSYLQNFDGMKKVNKKDMYKYLAYSIIVSMEGLESGVPQLMILYSIVDLSNNKFEREIPDSIGSLNSLIVLNLSHNNLTGGIPYALGKLSEIEALDLSCNRLTGEIPPSLADITTLEVLILSQNLLVGRIPDGTQFRTFAENSFGGNLGLCGSPLPKHCENVNAPQLEVNGDKEESGYTWKAVMLGYGCGTVLGLLFGYMMMSTGRPKWFNAIVDKGDHMIQMRRNKRRHVSYRKMN